MSSTYLLVFHGSRDRRSTASVAQLAQLVREQISHSDQSQEHLTKPLVSIASLEFGSVSLAVAIEELAQEAQSLGYQNLKIFPLFLLPGVHVSDDIPQEVNQANVNDKIKVILLPYLGSHPGLITLLQEKFSHLPASAKILLSHGSRRHGGNQPIEEIAFLLSAIPAYWSVSPSLAEQVFSLVEAGEKSIAIVPYFLFSGGITEQIAAQVQQLEKDFPQVKFYLGEPLGVTQELASLIIEKVTI